jgi:hypothetical protein|nr:MAG TPA: Morphogenesis protein 1 wall, phi29, hydrolase, infection [Caudoviricetes sp.]
MDSNRDYYCQGFIYNDAAPSSYSWHAKATGGYSRTSQEAKENASIMASILLNEGWSLKSVAAMLGNGAGESGLNPWRWESDYVPTVAEFNGWTSSQAQSHGYGLFQFTPANKYINSTNANRYSTIGYSPNFSNSPGLPEDGAGQTHYFKDTVADSWSHGLHDYYYDDFIAIGINIDAFYYATYSDFASGTYNGRELSLAELVGAFELCYERPGDTYAASSYNTRVSNAEYWYQYFIDNPPGPTPGPVKRRKHRMPIWLYFV